MTAPHTSTAAIREDCRQIALGAVDNLAPLKGQSILITGGTGFLGTWLAEMVAMLNDEHGFAIRLFLLSPSARSFAARLPHIGQRQDVVVLQEDVTNITDLPDEITSIIHAAASPDNRMHASDPLRLIRTIVAGTQTILEAATRLPSLRRFINISSGQVYGSRLPDDGPIGEHDFQGLDCSSVANTYAVAKRMGETLAATYRSQHRLPVMTVRPFAFVGPYQRLDRPWAINNFLRDALNGGPIRVHGDGQTVRSYMYGADAAWWLLTILAQGEVGKSYNLGSDQPIRIDDLAHLVADMVAGRPAVTVGLFVNSAPRSSFVPSLVLAHETLGLHVATSLTDALRKTISWNKKQD